MSAVHLADSQARPTPSTVAAGHRDRQAAAPVDAHDHEQTARTNTVAQPRFQLLPGNPRQAPPRVVGLNRSASTSEPARRDGQVTWRLLGANNRELGRSARSYPDQSGGWQAIERLRAGVARAEPRLSILTPRGNWGWQLLLDGEEVAVSARLFSRLRECRYSVEQFLEKVPDAGLTISSPTARDRRKLPHEPHHPPESSQLVQQ